MYLLSGYGKMVRHLKALADWLESSKNTYKLVIIMITYVEIINSMLRVWPLKIQVTNLWNHEKRKRERKTRKLGHLE